MPGAIKPDAMEEGLAAVPESDALDVKERVAISVPVAPLGDGAAVERWGWCVGRWGLRLPVGPAWGLAAGLGRQAEVPLQLLAGLSEGPPTHAHEQVEAIATTALVILAAALITEPGAIALVIVPAVTVGSTTGGAGLMTIGQLV